MANLQLMDRLSSYVQATADLPVDYITHDCARWAIGWAGALGFTGDDLPYQGKVSAYDWARDQGGPIAAADSVLAPRGWAQFPPVCGSIVCVERDDTAYFGISENGKRHIILSAPAGVRRIVLPVLAAWSPEGGF